jgi:rSAM/selenodomain-associated transferase 1
VPVSRRLLILARAARPGEAKTRLIPALGAEGAALLHERLTRHCLETLVPSRHWQTELHCEPDIDQPLFRAVAQDFGVERYAQAPGDLGQRMFEALSGACRRTRFAVLIGTDCPSLTADDVQSAFDRLEAGDDAVIGPAEDGGYVLIGLRRVDPALFTGIAWGGDEVLEATRKRLRRRGWTWSELEVRWDVDRPADLARVTQTPRLKYLLRGVRY